MESISAVIITKNEERYISRCLSSLEWADEILVVDAHSSDRTLEVCQSEDAPWKNKIRVMTRKWTGFKDQRNYAIRNAKHDWIFAIDADESCSPELAKEISRLAKDSPPLKAYKVRRQEYFLGKPIRWGIWNPSYQDRFFHRKGVEYINEVHEYPKFLTDPGRIEQPIYHSPDLNVERILNKMNRYTSIEAKQKVDLGQRTNLFRILFAFPAMFLKNYFYYRAYRDGVHGLIISLLEGVSRVVRHIKIWQLQRTLKDH